MPLTRDLRNTIRSSQSFLVRDTFRQETRPHSRTIAETYETKELRRGDVDTVRITSPYFWSGILDEGRGTVRPRSKRFLVWFDNPRDDPRLSGGYPKRRSDVKRLTRRQFTVWSRRNREAIKAGRRPPMVVTKGPIPGTDGAHFVARARRELLRTLRRDIEQVGRAVIEARIRAVKRRVLRVSFF